MTPRWKKATYATIAGLGLFVGSAGIAAATSSWSPLTRTTATVGAPTPTQQPHDKADTPNAKEDNANEGSGKENDADENPSYTGSVTVPEQAGDSEQNETDESKALEPLAKITADQARDAALAAVPGTATKVTLENENGSVVYAVEVKTAKGSVDVKVDAGTGKVLHQEAGDGEEHDANKADGNENDGATEQQGGSNGN